MFVCKLQRLDFIPVSDGCFLLDDLIEVTVMGPNIPGKSEASRESQCVCVCVVVCSDAV